MSINTEIERLNNAKNSIRNAIENKGVTVPQEEKISGFASYIGNIPTGKVDSVNGMNGDVVLTKEDIGLGNVPNVDSQDAGNITKGIISEERLPKASNTKFGIVQIYVEDGTLYINTK